MYKSGCHCGPSTPPPSAITLRSPLFLSIPILSCRGNEMGGAGPVATTAAIHFIQKIFNDFYPPHRDNLPRETESIYAFSYPSYFKKSATATLSSLCQINSKPAGSSKTLSPWASSINLTVGGNTPANNWSFGLSTCIPALPYSRLVTLFILPLPYVSGCNQCSIANTPAWGNCFIRPLYPQLEHFEA